jgi:hypothetical protein
MIGPRETVIFDHICECRYGFVQVSPPQETVTGTQWWTSYQVVSYTLTGKRGTRTQFANMISTCHQAGEHDLRGRPMDAH